MFGEASQLDLTFPLESAQNLVQKMERANLRRNPYYTAKVSGRNFQKLQGRLCSNLYFIKFVGQNLINQMKITEKMIKNISESDILHLKPVWAKYCSPQNFQFCNFLKLASDVFSTHGQNIIFPKWILPYLETSISMQALLLIWFMWKEYFRRN